MYFAVSLTVLKIPTVRITVYGSGKWEPDWFIPEKITKVLRVVASNLNIMYSSGWTGLYPEVLHRKQPVFPFENSYCKGCGYQGSTSGLTRPSTRGSIPVVPLKAIRAIFTSPVISIRDSCVSGDFTISSRCLRIDRSVLDPQYI